MKNGDFTAVIVKDRGTYEAWCIELDIVSLGNSAKIAEKNLAEAVSLFLEIASKREMRTRLRTQFIVTKFDVHGAGRRAVCRKNIAMPDNNSVPIPAWHLRELKKRHASIAKDPGKMLTLKEFNRQLAPIPGIKKINMKAVNRMRAIFSRCKRPLSQDILQMREDRI